MKFRPRLRSWFRRSTTEAELKRELEFHLEMEARAFERSGLTPAEARPAAERAFGGVEQAKEECRDAWGVRFLDTLRQDLAYAWRGLRHSPGFAAVVVLTLALGIGANTAIFSVVEGVLLKPLPYRAPDRLLMLSQGAPKAGQQSIGFSVPDFMDFRARTRAFSGLAEYHSMSFILLGRAEPERVLTAVVSDNFLEVLGVKPLLGRGFVAGEDRPGAPAVLMLSYEYWRSSFGADPNVVGQVFQMNNKPHTVVGVLPPLPAFPNADQVFMPASACPFRGSPSVLTHRGARLLSHVFGRMRDGVTPAQAADDVRRVGAELCGQFPQDYPTADGYVAGVTALARAFTGDARAPLLLLLTMSGFVLLLACANVANLTLARLLRRQREFALRAALGASRRRLMRQLLTESLVLATFGGAAGLLLAVSGMKLLVAYAHQFLPRADEIAINGPVLVFTTALTLLTASLFGCRPPRSKEHALAENLKDGPRGSSHRRNRMRSLLVVVQVAVAIPLLVGAGLAAHHLYNLQHTDPGIDTHQVFAANVTLNWTQLDTFEKRFAFWSRAIEEARKIPGTRTVAVSGAEPLHGLTNYVSTFRIENRAHGTGSASPHAIVLASSEDYFVTVGQPLLRGRYFTAADTHEAAPVAIINQTLASRYWPGEDPVGRRITFNDGTTWLTIVGVVAETRQKLDAEPIEELHVPLSNTNGLLGGTLLVRTSAPLATVASALRAAIHRADPNQPITSMETLADVREAILSPPRLTATLLGLFATVALLITTAGIGGLLMYSVTQRTPEIGIRMALGASVANVVWLVLRQTLALIGAGVLFGTLAASLVSHFMASMMYGVPAADPVTIIAVALVVAAVAVVACVSPARRAASISPATALQLGMG